MSQSMCSLDEAAQYWQCSASQARRIVADLLLDSPGLIAQDAEYREVSLPDGRRCRKIVADVELDRDAVLAFAESMRDPTEREVAYRAFEEEDVQSGTGQLVLFLLAGLATALAVKLGAVPKESRPG